MITYQIDKAETAVTYAIYAAKYAGVIEICIDPHIVLPYN